MSITAPLDTAINVFSSNLSDAEARRLVEMSINGLSVTTEGDKKLKFERNRLSELNNHVRTTSTFIAITLPQIRHLPWVWIDPSLLKSALLNGDLHSPFRIYLVFSMVWAALMSWILVD